jgi:site-specific recombinase XerD
MKINFYLRPSQNKEKVIQMFISFDGKREPMNTGLKVEESKWETGKQRVKMKYVEEAGKINLALSNLEEKAYNFKDTYHPQTPKLLVRLLKGVDHPQPKNQNEFFIFFEDYKNSAVPQKSIHNYNKCLVHLKSFSNKKYKVSWETLTRKFYQDYLKFMAEEYVNYRNGKTGILNSTIGKDIWVIKNICEYAKRQGIEVPVDVEDFSKPNGSITRRHFITEEKLKKLLEFDFTDWTLHTKQKRMKAIIEAKVIPNVLKVRDIYTFDFYTGLAHKETMDLLPSQVEKEKIGNKTISILDFSRSKTRKGNNIPLNKVCLEIIKKYKGGKKLLPYFTNAQYNRICKYMFKMAEFTEKITITRWAGDNKVVETFEEWELLTSHTGRHSAATNILRKTGDITLVKDLLGHSSVKTSEVYAKNIKESFNKKILDAID